MKKLILIVAMALVSSSVWGGVYIMGAGTIGCGEFVKERQESDVKSDLNSQWILGFISAINVRRNEENEDSVLGMDTDIVSIELWLENYCREHPLEKLYKASKALIVELEERESSQ